MRHRLRELNVCTHSLKVVGIVIEDGRLMRTRMAALPFSKMNQFLAVSRCTRRAKPKASSDFGRAPFADSTP
jgi:hypothetical protein